MNEWRGSDYTCDRDTHAATKVLVAGRGLCQRHRHCTLAMGIEQVASALKLLSPIAKLVPLVGSQLEGAVGLALEICNIVQVRQLRFMPRSLLSSIISFRVSSRKMMHSRRLHFVQRFWQLPLQTKLRKTYPKICLTLLAI
jgi:hypothetical protein